jgi:outer membrane protein
VGNGSEERDVKILLQAVLWLPLPAIAGNLLTYEEALEGTLSNNPTLQQSRYFEAQAKNDWVGERGIFDPSFELSGNYAKSTNRGFFQGFPYDSESTNFDWQGGFTGTTPTGTNWSLSGGLNRNLSTFTTLFGGFENEQTQDTYSGSFNGSVTQQLLKGVRLTYNLQNVTRAHDGWQNAQLSTELSLQEVLAQSASAYWAWQYATQQLQISMDSVEASEEALRVGRLKVEAGELAPVERTRLEAAKVQAQTTALASQNQERETRNSLLLLMGRAPGEVIEPATPVGTVVDLPIDPARAVAVALEQNLQVLLARQTVDQSELMWINARHGMLPSLSATLSAGTSSQVELTDSEGNKVEDIKGSSALSEMISEPLPTMSVGGLLTVPIGNRSARSARVNAEIEWEKKQLELQEMERSVQSQVEQQVALLGSARQSVDLADLNQRLAEEMLSAEEALVDAGRSIQKDVLEARTEVSRARAEAAKARTDYRLAQVELLRLQGQLTVAMP